MQGQGDFVIHIGYAESRLWHSADDKRVVTLDILPVIPQMHDEFAVDIEIIVDERFAAEYLQIQPVKVEFEHRINANRFRFTVFVVLTIIFITTAFNFALGFNTADSLTILQYTDVEVSYGDTLWSIAQTYMPADMDIREAIYHLCQLNDIRADQLYAGMTIQVPIYNQ